MGERAGEANNFTFCPAGCVASKQTTVRPHNESGDERGEWIVGEEIECGVCNVDDEEHGVVLPSIPAAPYIPTRQKRLEHEVTHFPYRSWCEHCVGGKARSRPHKYESDRSDGVPVIGLDYCFMNKKKMKIQSSKAKSQY